MGNKKLQQSWIEPAFMLLKDSVWKIFYKFEEKSFENRIPPSGLLSIYQKPSISPLGIAAHFQVFWGENTL